MDLGSEIRDPEKTYSGSRIPGSKRHRIPDPDPQHCLEASIHFSNSLVLFENSIVSFVSVFACKELC
jgi:hypothetical protein